jgi:hypothetical protein
MFVNITFILTCKSCKKLKILSRNVFQTVVSRQRDVLVLADLNKSQIIIFI